MICGHTTAEPVVSKVPLSCVPPCRCFGLSGATDRLWNCNVESPLFRLNKREGTLDSSCWQSARFAPLSPRYVVHCDEISEKLPLERMSPPSEPSKNRPGFVGLTTSACWSG